METEGTESAMRSQAPAVAAPIDLLPREKKKQWNMRGQKARDSEPWPDSLCVLIYQLSTRFL